MATGGGFVAPGGGFVAPGGELGGPGSGLVAAGAAPVAAGSGLAGTAGELGGTAGEVEAPGGGALSPEVGAVDEAALRRGPVADDGFALGAPVSAGAMANGPRAIATSGGAEEKPLNSLDAGGATRKSRPEARNVTAAAITREGTIRPKPRTTDLMGRPCYSSPTCSPRRTIGFMRHSSVLGVIAGLLVALVAVGLVVTSLPSARTGVNARTSGAPSGRLAGAATPMVSTEPGATGSPAATNPAAAPSLTPAAAASGIPRVSPSEPPGPSTSLSIGDPGASLDPSAVAGEDPGDTLQPSPPPVGVEIGDQAPDLRLPRLGGGTVDTAKLRGRPLWINFMATYCPPCIDELPLMERYQQRLGDSLRIVVVDVREDPAAVASFLDSLGVDLPVGLDADGSAQGTWAAYALPVHYWLDGEGRVVEFLYGGAGKDQFDAAIARVLSSPSPSP